MTIGLILNTLARIALAALMVSSLLQVKDRALAVLVLLCTVFIIIKISDNSSA